MRSTYCFSVHADCEPSTLPRVVEVLALHGLVPRSCYSRQTGPDTDELVVDLQLDQVTDTQAAAIAKRLGRVVTVRDVLWSQKLRQIAA